MAKTHKGSLYVLTDKEQNKFTKIDLNTHADAVAELPNRVNDIVSENYATKDELNTAGNNLKNLIQLATPTATDEVSGLVKIYDENGNRIDGTMTQRAITELIGEAAGKSAYELAVSKGYTGTLTEWLNSLKGERGYRGDTGLQGMTGPTGEAGYSPQVEIIEGVDATTGVDTHTIVVTDINGTKSTLIKNGVNGIIENSLIQKDEKGWYIDVDD